MQHRLGESYVAILTTEARLRHYQKGTLKVNLALEVEVFSEYGETHCRSAGALF